jgi:photosystem II stability/assembly factor-like uncharacterized protein
MTIQLEVEKRLQADAQELDRDFPSADRLEQRILARVAITSREERRALTLRQELVLAGLFVVMVALLAVGIGRLRAITQPVPARQTPTVIATPSVQGGGAFNAVQTPLFVSANLGWTTESQPGPAGPAALFQTTDGGRHWQRQLSWDCPGAAQLRFTADGVEGLVVGAPGQCGSPLFHTDDGGAHWQRFTFPPGAGQAVQTACKLGLCVQQNIEAQVYFLNPREGWVLSQETTLSVADLFHTTDSGAHWTRTARLDLQAQFNLDLARGIAGPSGRVDHALNGQLIFRDSSTGLLVVEGSALFLTHDGGATWEVQKLPAPTGIKPDQATTRLSVPRFFSDRDGVVELIQSPTQGSSKDIRAFVYTTADGGSHWSGPTALPGNVFVFINSKSWVGGSGGLFGMDYFLRTNDAGRHWDRFQPSGVDARSWDILTHFDFVDAAHGWALINGTLYVTSDGGLRWIRRTLPGY